MVLLGAAIQTMGIALKSITRKITGILAFQ